MDSPDQNQDQNISTSDVPTISIVLLLLLGLVLGGMLGSGMVYLISQAKGMEVSALLNSLNENSPLGDRNFIRQINLVSHLMTFTVPSLLAVWFFYRRDSFRFLKMHQAPGANQVSMGLLLVMLSFPLAQLTYWLNQQMPLPEWASSMEDNAAGLIKGLLVMENPGELLLNLLVVAIVPAIGEELLFRGLIQQLLQRALTRPHLAVWITAIIFSAFHLQFEGFIPRMLLGAILGYLFLWTRNLWIPILAHLLFNGFQVVAQYFYGDELEALNLESDTEANWISGLASLVLCILLGRYIQKINQVEQV
ncbi:MAG: hypothetical protein DHS20C18_45630 [Saprospiraceae bacterium]|nr:MAG: hypothetical protein DHS20C18_45630 [Saprospiraceae bacterium]